MTIQLSSSLKIPTTPAVSTTAYPQGIPAATNFSGSDSVQFSGIISDRKSQIEYENQRLPEETRDFLKSYIPFDPKGNYPVSRFELLLELLENKLQKKGSVNLYDIRHETHPVDQPVLENAFEELQTNNWIEVGGTQDWYRIPSETQRIMKKYFSQELIKDLNEKWEDGEVVAYQLTNLNKKYPNSIKAMKKEDFGQE